MWSVRSSLSAATASVGMSARGTGQEGIGRAPRSAGTPRFAISAKTEYVPSRIPQDGSKALSDITGDAIKPEVDHIRIR
tara:strand:- start:13497 stop:13733 length:237 start_codon:yes stop_codon:yes gene_type:complete